MPFLTEAFIHLKVPPQLTRNHDGHTVTHSLGLFHVVGGQYGSSLFVLKGSTDRPPIGVNHRNVDFGRPVLYVHDLIISSNSVVNLTTCAVLIWDPFL